VGDHQKINCDTKEPLTSYKSSNESNKEMKHRNEWRGNTQRMETIRKRIRFMANEAMDALKLVQK
jgi:hypothetical protein